MRAFLRDQFGTLLATRDCRRVRRVAGVNWLVRVVVPATGGDIKVADLDVDEQGQITPRISIDDLVKAVRQVEINPSSQKSRVAIPVDDPLGDLSSDDDEAFSDSFIDSFGDVAEGDAPPDDPDEVRRRVQEKLAKGDAESLRGARDMMPRLLADAERRGITLVWMAEIASTWRRSRSARRWR